MNGKDKEVLKIWCKDAGSIKTVIRSGRPVGRLFPRTIEVIQLCCLGFTRKEIGLKLGISERTVNWHVDQARVLFSAKNTIELVYLAMKAGVIE